MGNTSLPPIEKMLPHRHPFLFIQSVDEVLEDRILCCGMVERDHYLSWPGGAPPILGVEMGAQAAGVHAALQNPGSELTDLNPRAGYLVGIRRARFHVNMLPVGCALCVEAIARGATGPLATFRILITEEGNDRALVEARISTWAAMNPGK